MKSKKKPFSKLRSKITFRKRSKSSEATSSDRSSSAQRAREQHLSVEYDLSNACIHLEALMNAARFGNADLMYQLYLNNVDLKMTDDTGNNACHLAVMNHQQKIVRMIIVLCAPFPIWKQKNNSGNLPIELATDEKTIEDLTALDKPKIKCPLVQVSNVDSIFNDRLVKGKTKWEPNERVLFALDGGGVRALITIQMLIHLNALLDSKLVEKIDDFGGTSCGGVIALLLATNREVEDVRKLLLDMRDRVFAKTQGRGVWPKYNAGGIEYIARHVTTWEDSKMSIIKRHRVFVTVADTRMVPPQLLLFRSYCPEMSEEAKDFYKFFDPKKVELWKALRCTTAAPFFFESFNGLSDGGLIANNPTLPLIADFMLMNKLEKTFAKSDSEREEKGNWKVGCVVSLGTGIFPLEKIDGIDLSIPHMKNPLQLAKSFYKAIGNTKNMLNVLVKECTASNGQPVKYAREWCHAIKCPYFRFSPQLTQGIALDETDLGKIMHVMWETELYVAENRETLKNLAQFLSTKPKREEFAESETEISKSDLSSQEQTRVDSTTMETSEH
ncbi:unnamed protein product [Caenorhabditis angaria]|uniref:phospholipase A2 n=1 Tax=Caenorhabditis angaria TaxID=860376 RepID=A0A9P1IXW8_9PELO|nr:unnamed protein product [Caenorhabditis angaria]